MEKQVSRTNKYHLPKSIELTERKLIKLRLLHSIARIDQQLKKLEELRSLYPSHKVEDKK